MAAPVLCRLCPGRRWALAYINRGSRHETGTPTGSRSSGKRGQSSRVQQPLITAEKPRKGYTTISYHYSPWKCEAEQRRDWGDE